MSGLDKNKLFEAVTDFESGNKDYHLDKKGNRIFEADIPLWAEHYIINMSNEMLLDIHTKGYLKNNLGKPVEAGKPHKKLVELELIKRDAFTSDKRKTRAKA